MAADRTPSIKVYKAITLCTCGFPEDPHTYTDCLSVMQFCPGCNFPGLGGTLSQINCMHVWHELADDKLRSQIKSSVDLYSATTAEESSFTVTKLQEIMSRCIAVLFFLAVIFSIGLLIHQ